MTRVMKFGGSSLADAACLRRVAGLVREALPSAPLVVLSAMGKTTDALFRAAQAAQLGRIEPALEEVRALIGRHRAAADELFPRGVPLGLVEHLARHAEELELLLRGVSLLHELSPRSMDAIASHGEGLSTRLMAEHLRERDVPVELADARIVLRTDARFGAATPLLPAIARLCGEHLAPHLSPGRAVVIQGYIGATDQGQVTTLGRGGSDYSAALLGAALRCEEVQIWTDVEGVLSADPRIIPEAIPIPELSFAEAAELAAFGAKVLHPATIQPAVEAGVPVTVRHTARPAGRFTTISAARNGSVSPTDPALSRWRAGRPITALACRGPIAVLTLSSTRMFHQAGYLARVFEVFGRLGVSVDLIATAEVSISLTVEADAPIHALRAALEPFARVEVAEGRAIVALVGERIRSTPGVAGRIFAALGDINVEMISMGANEINLSLVVRHDQAHEALRRLHGALIPRPEVRS